jgi:hypothetical protein
LIEDVMVASAVTDDDLMGISSDDDPMKINVIVASAVTTTRQI